MTSPTEYNISITKAVNGWVIRTFDATQPGSMYRDIMVVSEGEDLGGMIAAAIMGERLHGSPASDKSNRLMWGDRSPSLGVHGAYDPKMIFAGGSVHSGIGTSILQPTPSYTDWAQARNTAIGRP